MTDHALTELEMHALKRAREVQTRAYAPYSRRLVGAAVIAPDGSIFEGCNVENTTDELGVCAERNAIAAAVAAGRTQFTTVIVVAPDDRLWPPCDSCRLVISEFSPDATVIMATQNGDLRRALLKDLASRPFPVDGEGTVE